MAEFTAINTQEEFDERIKERLQREAQKYEKYTSPEGLEKIREMLSDTKQDCRSWEGDL